MRKQDSQQLYVGRNWIVLSLITLCLLAMSAQAVYLQVITSDELNDHGVRSYVREMAVPAKRGMVLDRQGEPLAVSTPVDSIAADPRFFKKGEDKWSELAQLIDIPVSKIAALQVKYATRRFMYLRRHLSPSVGQQVKELRIPGVMVQREYRRFYPLASATGHIVGFTNIDDAGIEGVELGVNSILAGSDGRKRVLRDGDSNIIENLSLQRAKEGENITISIDTRIQYQAMDQLKTALEEHKAKAGVAGGA